MTWRTPSRTMAALRTALSGERGSVAGSVLFVVFTTLAMTAIVAAVLSSFAAINASKARTGAGDSAAAAYEIHLDSAIQGAPAPGEQCVGDYCADVISSTDAGGLLTLTLDGAADGLSTAEKLQTLRKLTPTLITGYDSLGAPVWADKTDTTPYRFTFLVSSGARSCGIEPDQVLWCWGENGDGQLGDGTTTDRTSPVKVDAAKFTAVATGTGTTTCAIDTAKAAWCWGDNTHGQLGTGAASVGTDSPDPVKVPGGHTFTAIANSATTTCAIDTAKVAWCWGKNPGNGSTGASPAPVEVAGGHTFTALSLDSATACGLDTAAKIWCWTDSTDGRPGAGPSPAPGTPVEVSGSRTYLAVQAAPQPAAGGVSVICALDSASKAWCWGQNSAGQLGNGTTTASDVPVAVSGSRAFKSLAVTPSSVCGMDDTTHIFCWGDNTHGQLGNGTTTASNVPVAVDAAGTYKSLAAGTGNGQFFCGVFNNGAPRCWGQNNSGQVKPGSTADVKSPATVPGLKNLTSVAAGDAFVCAVGIRLDATCWGSNASGQSGTGTATPAATPEPATRKTITPDRFTGFLKGGL